MLRRVPPDEASEGAMGFSLWGSTKLARFSSFFKENLESAERLLVPLLITQIFIISSRSDICVISLPNLCNQRFLYFL